MSLNQAKEIYEGFTNLIRKGLNFTEEDVEKMASYRVNICNNCDKKRNITNTCGECGCFIPAKTRSKHSSCPLGHWDAI